MLHDRTNQQSQLLLARRPEPFEVVPLRLNGQANGRYWLLFPTENQMDTAAAMYRASEVRL